MPSTQVVCVETSPCDQAEPTTLTPLTAAPDHCTGPAERGSRLARVAGLLRRKPRTGAGYYDPLFVGPDIVENDYYRFRHQPCG